MGGTFGRVNNMKVTASVRDGSPTVVVFRGTYSDGFDIEKRGQSGSPARKAWTELHQIAEAVGDSLTYR